MTGYRHDRPEGDAMSALAPPRAPSQVAQPEPHEKDVPWWERPLTCAGCSKVTFRPYESQRPCSWCGAGLR